MTEVEREALNLLAKLRRDNLRSQGLCINGAGHGEATHGVLCRLCREIHRGTRTSLRGER